MERHSAVRKVFALAPLLVTFWLGWAQAQSPKVGILLVVRSSDATWRDKLQEGVLEARKRAGYDREKLPLMVYRFDVATERANAEYLGVHASDLPFSGVVSVGDKGQPLKVLDSESGKDPVDLATAVFGDAQKRMAGLTAAAAPTPTGPAGSAPGLQFLRENAQGFNVFRNRDGSELIYIPGGDLSQGKHHPTIAVAPYYMARLEVSNEQFQKFVLSKGLKTTAELKGFSFNVSFGGPPDFKRRETRTNGAWWFAPGRRYNPKDPVTHISLSDAKEYAAWAGLRIPTYAEWTFAARGATGQQYPWRGRFRPGLCRSSVSAPSSSPATVGFIPGGFSPVGCLEMSGNVAEWCLTEDPNSPDGAERGGSYRSRDPRALRATAGLRHYSSYSGEDLGFRCARSVSAP